MNHVASPAAPPQHSEQIAIFRKLVIGFWSSPGSRIAWITTAVVLAFVGAQVGTQVFFNYWYRAFFDGLQQKDMSVLVGALFQLPMIVVATVVASGGLLVSKMMFHVSWRAWVTQRLAGWWIADQRYYRLGLIAPEHQAPEYRIAEDTKLAIEPLAEFVIGLVSATVTAITFSTILWSVAGSFRLTLGQVVIDIPAYMAVAAVIYAALTSTIAYLAGMPLVRHVADKNAAESEFRAELTRLRENAESIALIKGDKDELNSVLANYGRVVRAWYGVIRQQGFISILQNTNAVLFPVIPLVLTLPKYVSGEMTLGAVMQVASAFAAVQGSLIWFVDNVVKLAEWYASVRRVNELVILLDQLDIGTIMEGDANIRLGISEDGSIHIDNLSIAESAGRVVINDASVVIKQGERVMVMGESGVGKSTLIRALAGLWPWGLGEIRVPRDVEIAFVPQRPYIPLGTLRNALLYPDAGSKIAHETVVRTMVRCGLSYLAKRLDDEERWDHVLSGGERQRVAFCRLVLRQPDIIIMDEATSALDEDSQQSMLNLLHEELKSSTVISVGHRTGIEEHHDRKIILERRPAGAHMTSLTVSKSLWSYFRQQRA
ncbi:ABC transporter ATP-binding protein/permease [Candidatus Raskinella chloraquaticus]|uniref:ABC transporter ATP-binding protein n=1 Tax=Candidatus Raskinella chloraquaticus TaxID=1951219 RepID=A0A1W9HUQ8_9HYPH|nr:MAG: hypothetical protein A4S15_12455 [Proteobacteria bacterium SG_bin8]